MGLFSGPSEAEKRGAEGGESNDRWVMSPDRSPAERRQFKQGAKASNEQRR